MAHKPEKVQRDFGLAFLLCHFLGNLSVIIIIISIIILVLVVIIFNQIHSLPTMR